MEYTTKYQSIVLMGHAGTGKGTQSKKLAEALGYEIFSMGDMARLYASKDSALGRHIASIHLTGWIPEWLASYLMTKAIVEDYAEVGVVYESIARKPEEAKKFHEIHSAIDRSYIVIYLTGDEKALEERLLKRQRKGYDNLENIAKRRKAFEDETMVSIDHFRENGIVKEVDANQTPEKVFEDIMSIIKA